MLHGPNPLKLMSRNPAARNRAPASWYQSELSRMMMVAERLGWEATYDAEFIALTQLQADAFVTSDRDLAEAVAGLVETATVDALRTA